MQRIWIAVAGLAATTAHAGGDHGARVALPPAYVQECGACHTPYAPGLLPAASWQRLMGNLAHHFGTDASLDAAAAARLSSWLTLNAGDGRRSRAAPADDRITRADWFVREHRKVDRQVWQRASVRTPSNCGACHAQAATGSFDEHDITIAR